MRKSITVELRPCPCCGSTDLYAGVDSALSYAITCRQCGLKMIRAMPDKWPRGVRKRGVSEAENFIRLGEYAVFQAVAAWNTRPSGVLVRTYKVSILS